MKHNHALYGMKYPWTPTAVLLLNSIREWETIPRCAGYRRWYCTYELDIQASFAAHLPGVWQSGA